MLRLFDVTAIRWVSAFHHDSACCLQEATGPYVPETLAVELREHEEQPEE